MTDMKRFVVTMATTQVRDKGEIVTMISAQTFVEADYFRVQEGALIFRTERRGTEQYNPAVRVFAPGFWAEVQETVMVAAPQPARRFEHYARELDIEFEPEPVHASA